MPVASELSSSWKSAQRLTPKLLLHKDKIFIVNNGYGGRLQLKIVTKSAAA